MSMFVGLHTALSGIRAAQVGLNTASHNVANAGTPGYTRQRMELATSSPYASAVGPLGTGVEVTTITRIRDAFLDQRVRGADAESARQGIRSDLLARTEAVLAEPDQGLSEELGAVWDAFEDLAVDPANGAARQQVVSALGGLTARIRSVATGWDTLEADAATQISGGVREANDLLARVAELNATIPVAGFRGATPNDLLDERDLLVDRLSASLGVTATVDADGMVTLRAGDVTLVNGTTAERLVVGAAPGYALTLDDATSTPVVPGGEARGLQEFLTVDLPAQRSALDAFTTDLAAALNAQHALGYAPEPPGSPGGPLLVLDAAGGPSRTVQVEAAVAANPRRLAAASDPAVAPQDGRNAEVLAGLRTARVGGATLDDRVKGLVVALAGEVAGAARAAVAQEGLRLTAHSARQSVTSVSLDEEMVAVVAHQRALEAASRVMTAIDEALNVLINRTGVVGR